MMLLLRMLRRSSMVGCCEMINARSAGGVQLTDIETYWMTPFLGGGSPYITETSRVPIPHR